MPADLISNAFGHHPRRVPAVPSHYFLNSRRFIGVELELENAATIRATPRSSREREMDLTWARTNDGSLRNGGIEFVLRQPMWGDRLDYAIKMLGVYITNGPGRRTVCSVRTGLHVHVDVVNSDVLSVLNAVRLYSVLEPFVVATYAPERADNIFSNAMLPGNPAVDAVLAMMGIGQPGLRAAAFTGAIRNRERHYKYSSLNIYTLAKYGSLEFRCFPATKSPALIKEIVRLCMSIVDTAEQCSGAVQRALKHESLTGILSLFPNVIRNSLLAGATEETKEQVLERLSIFSKPSTISSKWETSSLDYTERRMQPFAE